MFNKTVAIDAADIHHDIMVKMILERVQDDEEEDLVVDEPSESSWSWQDLKDSISRSLSFEGDSLMHLVSFKMFNLCFS